MNESWEWEDWALGQYKKNHSYYSLARKLNGWFPPKPGDRPYNALDVAHYIGKAQKRQAHYPLSKPADILEFKRK